MQRNFKTSESDTFGGFDFSKVKLNSSGSRGESHETSYQGVKDSQVGSWGQSPPSNSPRYRTSSGGSPAQTSSSLLKPARLSFSPPESVQSPSTSETSLSQTLFYSSTPRVVYVQIPSAVAEQGYLKLVCYLFTLVIVYIIYNEYRISKMYGTGHTWSILRTWWNHSWRAGYLYTKQDIWLIPVQDEAVTDFPKVFMVLYLKSKLSKWLGSSLRALPPNHFFQCGKLYIDFLL